MGTWTVWRTQRLPEGAAEAQVKGCAKRPRAAIPTAPLTWEGRRIVSDVDESVAEVAGWVTPRRGGVGPTTVAMLLSNAVRAARGKLEAS